MKIHLHQIHDDVLHLEGSTNEDIFQIEDPLMRFIGPVEWSVDAGLSGGGLWVHGRVAATFEFQCVACLTPFLQRVEVSDFATQIELTGPEMIDLTEQIREDILINLPTHPRCDWDGSTECKQSPTPQYKPRSRPFDASAEGAMAPEAGNANETNTTESANPATSAAKNPTRDPAEIWSALDKLHIDRA